MTHHTEAERAEFEKLWAERPIYMGQDHQKELALHWWQAARRAPAAPVPQDVIDALDRMDALLKPGLRLLAVGDESATAQASRRDMATIRAAALAAAPQPPEAAPEPNFPIAAIGFNREEHCIETWSPSEAARVQLPEPELYVSKCQLDAHTDPDAGKHGRYIPARKTASGNFTHPLYGQQPLAAQERKPQTDEQVDDFHGEANRGFDIERDAYFKAFRDAERAHNIG